MTFFTVKLIIFVVSLSLVYLWIIKWLIDNKL